MFENIEDEDTGVTHITSMGRKLCGVPDGSYKPGQKPAPSKFGITCSDCHDAIEELAELTGLES